MPSRTDHRERILYGYLAVAVRDRITNNMVTRSALWCWESASQQLPTLPVPDAGISDGGDVLLTWDTGTHHAEIECRNRIGGGTDDEWFYLNHETGAMVDGDIANRLPDELLEKLKLFVEDQP